MNYEDPTPNLQRFKSYKHACEEFRLHIPDSFNIADAICRKHKDAVTRIALIEVKEAADNTYTFGALNFLSDKCAIALGDCGITEGDRVAVILPQSAALAVAHLAALKSGAAVVSLSPLASPAMLEYALRDSAAKAIVIDENVRAALDKPFANLPALEHIFAVTEGQQSIDATGDPRDFWREINAASSDFKKVETDAKTPAFIFYAFDSTEDPAGIVYGHGSLPGHLPSFEMSNNFDLSDDVIFWTPADWASADSLLNMLYPAWYYGGSVIARASQIQTIEEALSLMERCEVTNALIPFDEMDKLKQDDPGKRYDLKLRAVSSSGVALTQEHYDWAKRVFAAPINFGYAALEAGSPVTNCERWFAAKPGSAGRAAVGHRVEIVDETGQVLPAGREGLIAIDRSDPALFNEYLNRPQMTADAFIGDWFITGDSGFKDEEGYLHVQVTA